MDYQLIALGIVAMAVCYVVVIRPKLAKVTAKDEKGLKEDETKKLTLEMLNLIDFACVRGVQYAEQLYKTEEIDKDGRNKIALDYAFDVVSKAGLVPKEYTEIIKGMVEARVLNIASK